jgi:hypothetical protein
MPKSIYLDNNFLNAALRGIPFVPPPAVYVALYTVAPGVDSAGTEVAGGGYFRQLVTFTEPVNGQVVSAVEVLFPVAQALWGSIVAFAFIDASSGGNILYIGNLSAPKLVDVSDQVRMPAGQLICIEG